MNEPVIPESTPQAESSVAGPPGEETPSTPPALPEPWTPERVSAWNAYYDVYVAAGVVLLTFLASAHKIGNPGLWPLLETGRLIADQGAPVVRDPFSYTMRGSRWINIPWLFEWINYLLYQWPRHLYLQSRRPIPASADVATRAATLQQRAMMAQQVAAGTLVAVNALMRGLTALILLRLRRPGPGLWWVAVCAGLALGGMPAPGGSALGGIAGPAAVAPETWGLLLLAVELVILHRTVNLGRSGSVYWLVPLFLFWANVDESFVFGLIVLATTVLGALRGPRSEGSASWTFPRGLAVLLACLAVTFANPSFHRTHEIGFAPIVDLVRAQVGPMTNNQLSFFGPESRRVINERDQTETAFEMLQVYYAVLVGLGLASFALNRKRFALGRFLSFVVVAALWGALIRLGGIFALVFAATLAQNGQEWYQDRFGVEGRLGQWWAVWSVGGRAVTIGLIFWFLVKALTGYGNGPGEPSFGFGADPTDFAFEAADYLRSAPIRGKVLNTSTPIGDALIWGTHATRPTFLDDRAHVFPPALDQEYRDVRMALSKDDVAKWKPILDKYGISVVLLNGSFSAKGAVNPMLGTIAPNTYQRLMLSPNWIPFYDRGNVIMFGRADVKDKADLAYFQSHRLNPDAIAYRREEAPPPAARPPSPVTWFDRIFQDRSLMLPGPHVLSAERWLSPVGGSGQPDPARCLLAVREARSALAQNPDDPDAFRDLALAYGILLDQESALMARSLPTSMPGLLTYRLRQQLTALNFAIQTTPPPSTLEGRQALATLHSDLARLYQFSGCLDLQRDQLQAARVLIGTADFPANALAQLEKLNERIEQIQVQMTELSAEQQVGPLQRAQMALANGAVGLAIAEMEDVGQAGVVPPPIKAKLIDLYCEIGRPDKVFDLVGDRPVEDPPTEPIPGIAAHREGLLNLLLGDYERASTLWRSAIQKNRYMQGSNALGAGTDFVLGRFAAPSPEFPDLRGEFLNLRNQVATEGSWNFELGLCLLESGDPRGAAECFQKAMRLGPAAPTRPIMTYYLEKMGQPVPPPPVEAPPETEKLETLPADLFKRG